MNTKDGTAQQMKDLVRFEISEKCLGCFWLISSYCPKYWVWGGVFKIYHIKLRICCIILFSPGAPCSKSTFQEDGCQISKQMMTYLANYMRNGDPNSPATSHIWPLYRASQSANGNKLLSVRHASFSRVTKNYKQEKIALWNRYQYYNNVKARSSHAEVNLEATKCDKKSEQCKASSTDRGKSDVSNQEQQTFSKRDEL